MTSRIHVKVGAFPLIVVGSPGLTRRFYEDVPAKFDTQTDDLAQKVAGFISARISFSFDDAGSALTGLPEARVAAVAKAHVPITQTEYKRGVRRVVLGNSMYPSAAQAKQYGVTEEQLRKIFWDGISMDATQLQATGESTRKILESGKEMHITHPNGTNLKIGIAGRRVIASDGILPSDDVKRGKEATIVWLPAGEVYLSPVLGTSEGTFVLDRAYFQNTEIRNLKLAIKGGKITSVTADSGLDRFKAVYDAAGPGHDEFSSVDIGINPNVVLPDSSPIGTYVAAGSVSVGLGDSTFAGGETISNFGIQFVLRGSTVTIDGKPILENGKLR